MSRVAKWIWNADTPASVPAGARISAGKFGQGREVVTENRGRVGEATAGQLHAVARVAREADDNPLALFNRLIHVHSSGAPAQPALETQLTFDCTRTYLGSAPSTFQ